MIITISACQSDGQSEAAIESGNDWLTLIDAGHYKASWKAAAPFFKESVAEQDWEKMVAAVRKPLGEVTARELLSTQYATSLPRAPKGEYFVIQFKTDFAEKPDAVETITPMKTGEEWRVSGYYIK